ncbi:SDR family oxidoreductase [Frankia sp. Ag45/Mut15]|uniref:SDR family oxidoreductase n=1 Tax=Frankia umida TaxID=573489 RepID=A0ABT0K010_9ACTN|nr:SDR family oxidoreductase [Frankia umida]MCK9877117.1 SDR family oxidoreductase [Frankia umida]
MDLQLAGRRAIVTGGSRGIGRAIARALLAEGVQVVIAARNAEALKATAAELTEGGVGRTVLPVVADAGDDASVRELVEQTVAALGGIDILVNNAAKPGGAGAGGGGTVALSTADAAADFNVKVLGYLRTAQAVTPYFTAQGWGRIINIGGLAARQVGLASGSIRNVGVAALTKTLADELGQHGVTVNVVHPGLTLTADDGGSVVLSDEQIQAAAARIALGRAVTADEVAALVTFLASPLSVAVTGESIAAGGGTLGPIHY